jgi:hypothetical protein
LLNASHVSILDYSEKVHPNDFSFFHHNTLTHPGTINNNPVTTIPARTTDFAVPVDEPLTHTLEDTIDLFHELQRLTPDRVEQAYSYSLHDLCNSVITNNSERLCFLSLMVNKSTETDNGTERESSLVNAVSPYTMYGSFTSSFIEPAFTEILFRTLRSDSDPYVYDTLLSDKKEQLLKTLPAREKDSSLFAY